MKLIQQLERKLSWRRKKQSPGHNTTSAAKLDKPNRRVKKAFSPASIKVNDNEFSQYIRFANPLRTVATCSVPSYEIVSIRTRSPFASDYSRVPALPHTLTPPVNRHVLSQCSYRSSSPRCEATLDMHIYDRLDKVAQTQQYDHFDHLNHTDRVSPQTNRDKFDGIGPTTVTRRTRRNRIKTNPWFSSPWAGKTLPESSRNSQTHLYKAIENDYESVDNGDWQALKENVPLVGSTLNASDNAMNNNECAVLRHFEVRQPQPQQWSIHNPNTPHQQQYQQHQQQHQQQHHQHHSQHQHQTIGYIPHHFAEYPQSAIFDGLGADQDLIDVAPSPEFVSQSHRICSEISDYFSPRQHSSPTALRQSPSAVHENSVDQCSINRFDSMETIDLSSPDLSNYREHTMSEWSVQQDESPMASPLHSPHLQHRSPSPRTPPTPNNTTNQSISSASTSTPQQSPVCASKRQVMMDTTNNKLHLKTNASKRKRPESTYSSRQSKKVDKLKCQLKEVVHAAMQEAKKEDTKKA